MKRSFNFCFNSLLRQRNISFMKRNLDTPDIRSRKLKPVQNMANTSGGNVLSSISTPPSTANIKILPTPLKSENDKKDYRVIQLENGLIALLIADCRNGYASAEESMAAETEDDSMEVEDDVVDGEGEETEGESEGSDSEESKSKVETENETLSAASLTIKVGSFQDPDDIPGLAHFLEHMVFMGSEKYPQENDFDAFIKKQGGHDNAATDWDVTTFYFVSQERHLRKALDKFAQFFISPLMKKDAMQREREAIESEFNLALPSDYHRKKQLLGSFAKKNHPANKFPWGNVSTLGGNSGDDQEKKDTEIHARLHEFRKSHYIAQHMTLALQSRHDLDTLQEWVIQCFGDVPSGSMSSQGEKLPQYPEKPFDTPEFRQFYKVLPVKDICQVDLTWALPSMLKKYKKKPDKYISWLLGHEGKGSLLQYLREKVWALQLYSGNDESGSDHNTQYMQFGVTLVLTDDGLANLSEVIKCIFSYMKMLQDKGPQERIFREMQQVMDIRFRFTPEPNAGDNVETLSENMHKYPPEHYIAGSELYFEYDPQEITECLELLTPDNVNIILFNKNDKEKYEHAEKWFSTPYSVQDIRSNALQIWREAEPLPCFHLPEPNPYLATDFSLLATEITTTETYPEKLECDDKGELWFKQDAKFMLPRAFLCFQLVSPLAALSPTNSVLLDLFLSILKQQLNAEVYPAEIAELSYSLYPSIEGTGHGLGLGVSGFNQKLPLLLEAILKQMMKFDQDLNDQMFLAIKDKQKKQYFNSFLKPGKVAKDVNQSLLKSSYWGSLDRYAAIDDVTSPQLAEFARQFRSRLYIRALMQGNLSKEHAVDIMNMVKNTLNYKPLLPNTWPQLRLGQVELGSRICRVASFNKESANSVVAHSFHCGLATIKDCCTAELIMLMLEETVFDTLRTKEQLGYDVSCRDSITRGVLNFSITVHSQEDKHSLDHVDSRIWSLLEGFVNDLKKLSAAELEELRISAMKHKLKADLQLQEEVDRNWEEVCTAEYLFNRRHIEHEALSKISLEDMTSWLHRYVFDPEYKRHLTLQVQGYSQVEENLKHIITKTDEEPAAGEDKTDGPCLPNGVEFLLPEDKTLNPITDIEQYRSSIYFYPVHKVLPENPSV